MPYPNRCMEQGKKKKKKKKKFDPQFWSREALAQIHEFYLKSTRKKVHKTACLRDNIRPMEKAKNKNPKLCPTKYCRNKRSKYNRECAKCRMRKWRQNNPISYAYRNIVDRAHKKNIECSLTILEFEIFCHDTGYLTTKGVHIDRIEATEGYHYWNIQALSSGENIAKGNRERHSKRYQEYLKKRKEKKDEVDPDNCPF
jgi:hypothetical protein